MATNDSTSTSIEIPLDKGYVTFVDECDADLLKYKWIVRISKSGSAYAWRRIYENHHRITYHLHRVILSRILGRELQRSEDVDHVSRNTLDNRRSNLRLATRTQNNANMKLRVDNQSGFKGVRWHPGTQKWRAEIQRYGKRYHLGLFPTPEEAHRAYCEAAVRLFGEFSRFK